MPSILPGSHVYYFHVGEGTWTGRFSFHVTNWESFWKDPIGFKYRVLVLIMVVVEKLLGRSRIVSRLQGFPDWGTNGVATNVVRIEKFGITTYLLKEQYVLNSDGQSVFVHSFERFGPIPGMFATKKKHPARIRTDGSGAHYIDMPLLGTIWEGKYQVKDGGNRIDADLTCQWGSAKETISRVGERIGPPISRSRPVGRALLGLEDVYEQLTSQQEWYDAVRDRRAIFTHAYAQITKVFQDQIDREGFRNKQWIEKLDVEFAREYFKALDAYDLGLPDPPGWIVVFELMRKGKTSVLEELAIAMTVHIIHDLPFALIAAGHSNNLSIKVFDFHKANDVLQKGVDTIQATVSKRYNRFVGFLDRLGSKHDEVMTNYVVRLARAAAWYNADRLLDDESNPEVRESLARSTKAAVNHITNPSFWLIRLGVALTRWVSGLFRKWPQPTVL